MSNIPKPQKYMIYLTWAFAGVMSLGGFIGVINDTLDLISLPISITGTAVIIAFYIAAQQYLRRYPWHTDTGRITRLNIGMVLPLVGMVALLWVPQVLQLTPEKRHFPSEKVGETLIVVATFHRTEGVVDVDAHSEIQRAIQGKIEELNLDNVRVHLEPTIIQSTDRDRAKELGRSYDASLIIWGADTGIRLEVDFLNLKEPDFDAASVTINETEKTQLAHPDAYSQFIINELPGQLAFLALFAIGQADYANENYESAIALIEESLVTLESIHEIDSKDLRIDSAYFILAMSNYLIGDYLEAAAYYDDYLETSPNNVNGYLNQGVAYIRIGEYDKAIANFENALSLDPESVYAYANLGVVYMFLGDFNEARNFLNQAQRLDPEEFGVLFNLGVINLYLGEYDKAISKFNEFIAVYPEDASAYTNRGISYSYINDYDSAINDFNKAISINPNIVKANSSLAITYLNRGLNHLESGQYENAIADFGKHLEMNSQSPYRDEIEEIIIDIQDSSEE